MIFYLDNVWVQEQPEKKLYEPLLLKFILIPRNNLKAWHKESSQADF